MVRIPDLYADTNHDGIIGANDVLYSLVDIPLLIETPVTYSFFDVFAVLDGEVSGLKGMLFSTTDFVFNPDTDFAGTPYTGDATVFSEHWLSVAEPGLLSLLGMGGVAAALERIRCRKASAPARTTPA